MLPVNQMFIITQVFIIAVVFKDLIAQVLQIKVKDMTQQDTTISETVQTMLNVRSQRQHRQRVIVMFYREKQTLVHHFTSKMKR